MRNLKLSGMARLLMMMSLRLMRQQQLDNMQLTASKPSGALWWREEKGVFPPFTPYPRKSLLARRLPYKLSLVISFVTLICHSR